MIGTPPQLAFVALGSNLGDRSANLLTALDRLAGVDVRIQRVSSFLDNAAVGGPSDSPPFLNAVAAVETSLDPVDLLHRLLDVEREMGRARSVKWEPRLIDLDLLLYDNRIVATESLTLPHPLLHLRPFVLKPLAEIAPEVVHPVLGETVRTLRDRLKK